MDLLSIGKVAQDVGVGVETVRFYQREGLITEHGRTDGGYRQYTRETVSRIRFIKRAKELGFTLKQIKELLCLSADPETTCQDIKIRAQGKIVEIEKKIRLLQKMKKTLTKLIQSCKENLPVDQCPILETLEQEEN